MSSFGDCETSGSSYFFNVVVKSLDNNFDWFSYFIFTSEVYYLGFKEEKSSCLIILEGWKLDYRDKSGSIFILSGNNN